MFFLEYQAYLFCFYIGPCNGINKYMPFERDVSLCDWAQTVRPLGRIETFGQIDEVSIKLSVVSRSGTLVT